MEARMTICNMSIEMGARGGMIAPDEKTFAYLKGASKLGANITLVDLNEAGLQETLGMLSSM